VSDTTQNQVEAELAAKHNLSGMALTMLHCELVSLAKVREEGVTYSERSADDLGQKLTDAQLANFARAGADNVSFGLPAKARKSLDLDTLAATA